MPIKPLICAGAAAWLALAVPAQAQQEQLERSLLGLTAQLEQARAQEQALASQTFQLQRYRAQSLAQFLRLKDRQSRLDARGLTAFDVHAFALGRYVENDLTLNLRSANQQLQPLDDLRAQVIQLSKNVEKTRSALVMGGSARADLSDPTGPARSVDLSTLPKPEGVFAERQSTFRTFPSQSEAQVTKPLILPLRRAELAFNYEQDDPDDTAKLYFKGIQLNTPAGAAVFAPFEGEIAYAAPYRSFGNLVVIEHEGGGATLLAGLHSFAISVGDWVRQGAPVGLMTADSNPPPRLYFEFRIDQSPVDPLALVGSITNE